MLLWRGCGISRGPGFLRHGITFHDITLMMLVLCTVVVMYVLVPISQLDKIDRLNGDGN